MHNRSFLYCDLPGNVDAALEDSAVVQGCGVTDGVQQTILSWISWIVSLLHGACHCPVCHSHGRPSGLQFSMSRSIAFRVLHKTIACASFHLGKITMHLQVSGSAGLFLTAQPPQRASPQRSRVTQDRVGFQYLMGVLQATPSNLAAGCDRAFEGGWAAPAECNTAQNLSWGDTEPK